MIHSQRQEETLSRMSFTLRPFHQQRLYTVHTYIHSYFDRYIDTCGSAYNLVFIFYSMHSNASIFDCITNAFFCIVAAEKAKQREANEAVGGAVIVVLLLAVFSSGLS